jgi:succinyl-diaminopimelate desuccinylase
VDVVPSGEGWSSKPFTPTIKDEYLYGRGAQDMKSGLSAFLIAISEVKEFNGTLSILITTDEEGDAHFGTIEALRHLKEIDLMPNYCIVAEPTSEERFGDAIKVGRRGSINGVLKLKGKQGHAAYPEKAINPIHQIAPVLQKVAGVNLDSGDEFFAPSKLVLTDIRSGLEVTNVTPNELKLMFNIRNSTKTSIDDVERYIKEVFDGLDFELKLTQGSYPFRTNRDSKIVKLTQDVFRDVMQIDTKLSTAGGTSDARFFGEFGIDVVEIGVCNDTIHSVDERVKISEVEELTEIFKTILKRF